MDNSLLKDIILVFLGGVVTFIFTLLILRVQRREPSLSWRKFPVLEISTQGLSGLSWLIENEGRKSAKDVRLYFKLPENAKYQSFEVELSEPALHYSIDETDESKRSIVVPVFTQGVSLGISCLISNLSNREVEISIVGEDIIGSENKMLSKDYMIKLKTRLLKLVISLYVLLFLLIITTVGFVGIMSNSRLQLEHTNYLADLFIKNNDYESAIKLYESFNRNSFLLRNISLTSYKLAQIYALKNDTSKCIFFLSKAFSKDNSVKDLIETDNTFDPIRSSVEFKEFINKIKE